MIDHDYPGRFALVDESAKDAVQIPSDWIWRQSGKLRLATDPQLPLLDITSSDGRPLGWLLGYPIDTDTQTLLTGSFPLPAGAVADPNIFEQHLYRLGGRFAAIVLTEKWQRYYPDAAGLLAAFLCAKRRAIISTPALLRDPEPVDAELRASLHRATQASGTWFPMGLSGYRDTVVALPNHHVDLQTWTARRHWPRAAIPLISSRSTRHVVREIFDILRATIAAVAKQYPLAMDLTGGRDSRMLLAAALPFTSQIEFRTNLDHSPADGLIAEGLSRFFGFQHNNPDVDRHTRVLLRGHGGEVGRGYFWSKCPGGDAPPSAEQLLQAHDFPEPHEALRVEASRWLADLPNHDRGAILDLAYFESGCTMSHVLYNSDTKYRFALAPLNHRRIYECILSLPHEFRRRQRLVSEICRLGSPLLNLFPINSRHFIGLTKYKKYCSYLWHRRSMSIQQRAIVRNYCTRGRTLPQMLRDDLLRRKSPTPSNQSAEIATP